MSKSMLSNGGMRQIRVWTAGVLFFSFVMLATVFAQLPTATILGVVKDSSGAVVPDVALTARNVDTGQTRNTSTDANGAYRFSAMPVGNYEVRAEKAGFNASVQSGLTLTVSQEAVVNITLQVGSAAQTVSVTAEAPLVNTTSGSLGGLVSEDKVADLPLNGRNYIDLTMLQMGVNQQVAGGANGNAGFSGQYFSSNGAPVRSNIYLMDGAIMNNVLGATSSSASGSTLGVDGIREFRVITNSFSAEYGMTMGSQMIIVSKSGANAFHGDAFEYLRNSAMDAANFFDKPTQANGFRRLPEFRRNNFGGSFGGPIKKDKTFFFGVFEGVKEAKGITTIDTVPVAACHTANNIVDNQACLGATTAGTTTVSPVMQPILALFPSPNLPGLPGPKNNYTFPYTQPTDDYFGQMRVDQNFSANDTVFARYTIQNTTQSVVQAFPEDGTDNQTRSQFLTLSENHIFSPTLLNTFRASFSRSVMNYRDFASAPIGPNVSITPGWQLGNIGPGGYSLQGTSGTFPFLRKQNIFTYSDDMFYTRGRHSLKFGILFNHYQNYLTGNAPIGTASFSNLQNFLLGNPTTVNSVAANALLDRTFHYNTIGLYAQDDWRIRPNLTLNLGLRYEFLTIPQEQKGQWGALQNIVTDANFTVGPALWGRNPSLTNFSPRIGFAWDVMGDGKTAVKGGFGLLYDVGNFGALIFQSLSGNPPLTLQNTNANPGIYDPTTNPTGFRIPYSFTGTTSQFPRPTYYYMGQPHLLSYNLAIERQLPFEIAVTIAYAGSRGIDLAQLGDGNPSLPNGVPNTAGTACVAPAAGQVVNPASQMDGSATSCFLASPKPLRRNPNWSSLDLFSTGAGSIYNALQFGVTKRLSKGVEFQSSYTWSHAIDDNPGYSNVEQTPSQSSHSVDALHPQVDRGNSILDITHVWKFNVLYNLPRFVSSEGFAGKLVNGWWMSGILTIQGGLPFTPDLNSNRSKSGLANGGAGNDRPDVISGRTPSNIVSGALSAPCGSSPAGTPLGTPNLYFDPCAFSLQPQGFYGTAGRNILRGPNYRDLDFSLVKDTSVRQLGESGKVEFRVEVFNILNHPIFAQPARAVFAGTETGAGVPLSTAGLISATAINSRQLQLALKVIF